MNPKLLIVDDERGIVDMIQSYFQTQYDILTAYSGQEALKKVACKPDLILLDINMPGMDGLTVCQQIREHIACPILFLTARIESSDKIIGFQAGADDYIVKPFDLDELGARIAAHLRREQRRQNNSAVRFFGELILDYSARTVTINNQNIPLSKREFEIVELLSLNAGQVFDRERIYELVWGAWMGTETAIQLWSTFGKYALNLQHIHCTITLKRFGGVVIGGTPKKYGTKEIFPAIIPLLFGSGISPAWGSYLPMPRH